MKVIIAGSRGIKRADIGAIVAASGFDVTEVVSGQESSINKLSEKWANQHGIPVKPFPAAWNDIGHPDAVIHRDRKDGTPYDANAGQRRNRQMVQYADALIFIPAHRAENTHLHIVQLARAWKLKIYIANWCSVGREHEALQLRNDQRLSGERWRKIRQNKKKRRRKNKRPEVSPAKAA